MPGFSLLGVNHQEALTKYQRNPDNLCFPSEIQSLNNGLIKEQVRPTRDHSGVVRYMAIGSCKPATDCIYCGDSLKEAEPLGIPVSFDDLGNGKYRIFVEAWNVCSFDCMVGHIRLYSGDPNYSYSENIAMFWFSQCYPNEEIQTFDRRILIRYAGAQDRKSIHRFVFRMIPNLELAFRGSTFST